MLPAAGYDNTNVELIVPDTEPEVEIVIEVIIADTGSEEPIVEGSFGLDADTKSDGSTEPEFATEP